MSFLPDEENPVPNLDHDVVYTPTEEVKNDDGLELRPGTQEKEFIKNTIITVVALFILTVMISIPLLLIPSIRESLSVDGVYISAFVIFLALYNTIVCCYPVSRTAPFNYLLLILLPIPAAVIVSCFYDSHYNVEKFPMILIISVGVLIVACVILGVLAYTAQIDLVPLLGAVVLFMFALAFLSLWYILFSSRSSVYLWVIGIMGAIIVALQYTIDFHVLAKQKHLYSILKSDYVLGASILYFDTVLLFTFVFWLTSLAFMPSHK